MSKVSALGARWRAKSGSERLDVVAWLALPLAGVVWMALRYKHNWYYYDEWSAIDRAKGSWGGVFDGHQGHLAFENYVVYRLQRAWLGVEGHELVWGGFVASLAAFHVCVAALLRRLGLPTLLALLAGAAITYFGPGAQNMAFEFQQNINFALALCFVAGVVAARKEKTRPAAIAIAVLLVAAVANDSGVALLGCLYVGVLVVLLWPRRLAATALLPPLIALLLWHVVGNPGPHYSAPFDEVFEFAWRMFLLSAGGLVGGGETPSPLGSFPTAPTLGLAGTKVGLIVLLGAGTCVAYGLRRHRLSRPVVATLIAGTATAVIGVCVLATTRAFIFTPDKFPGSRYVQWIAVFLLLAIAPSVAAAVRPMAVRASRVAFAVAAIALVAIFVVNLNQLRPARAFSERWGAGDKSWVREAVTVVAKGCGPGRQLNPDATAEFSPQVTVALVRELLDEGSLTPRFGAPVSPARRPQLCPRTEDGRSQDAET